MSHLISEPPVRFLWQASQWVHGLLISLQQNNGRGMGPRLLLSSLARDLNSGPPVDTLPVAWR